MFSLCVWRRVGVTLGPRRGRTVRSWLRGEGLNQGSLLRVKRRQSSKLPVEIAQVVPTYFHSSLQTLYQFLLHSSLDTSVPGPLEPWGGIGLGQTRSSQGLGHSWLRPIRPVTGLPVGEYLCPTKGGHRRHFGPTCCTGTSWVVTWILKRHAVLSHRLKVRQIDLFLPQTRVCRVRTQGESQSFESTFVTHSE